MESDWKNWILQRKKRFVFHLSFEKKWERERENPKYKFFPPYFFVKFRKRHFVKIKVKMTNMKLASETQCTVVVAGDSRVGKTSLIQRFVNKTFQQVRQTNKLIKNKVVWFKRYEIRFMWVLRVHEWWNLKIPNFIELLISVFYNKENL